MYLHDSLYLYLLLEQSLPFPHCIQSDTSAQGVHRPRNGFIYDTQHQCLLFTFITREHMLLIFDLCKNKSVKTWHRGLMCSMWQHVCCFLKHTGSSYIDLVHLQQFASNNSHYSVKREGVLSVMLTWWSPFTTQKNPQKKQLSFFPGYFTGTEIYPLVCILGLILWLYYL